MSEPLAATATLAVSELVRLARVAIERALPVAWVAGEISNLTRAPSGHWYFTLKDAGATVRCAMFRNRNQFVDWRPEDGMRVEVRAQATLYEPRGEFQLTVEAMRRAGQGALFEAFLRLKDKLEQEGLFDPARKRPLPAMPMRIGIVTSPRAAALRDVLSTLRRRWPLAGVVLYPAPVQGEAAAERLAAAVRVAGERRECTVLLLVRGGGSLEDLWPFNEEILARAVATCPIPIVAGIGHETDFSIADFAADLRAATPTAAAQLATPDAGEWLARTVQLGRALGHQLRRRTESLGQRVDGLSRGLNHPAARLVARSMLVNQLWRRQRLALRVALVAEQRSVDTLGRRLAARVPRPADAGDGLRRLTERLRRALAGAMHRHAERISVLRAHLAHLDPEAVLGRGYAIARARSGAIITDAGAVSPGDLISVILARGRLVTEVVDVVNGDRS